MTIAATWRKGSRPDVFLRKIVSCIVKQSDGGISFSGYQFHDALLGIQHSLIITPQVHECYLDGLVLRAVRDLAKAGTMSTDQLLADIKKLLHEHLKQPTQRFIVQSSLSIHDTYSPVYWRYRLPGVAITVGSKRTYSTDEIDDDIARKTDRRKISRYSYCHVALQARSVDEAGYVAIDSIDLIRAIWNLVLNSRVSRRWSSERSRVNMILSGPIHTIHTRSGKIVSDVFFYEEWSHNPPEPCKLGNQLSRASSYTSQMWTKIKRHRYRNDVQAWLIRYTRALDDTDYDALILKLWSLLESLTYTVNERYQVTIDRTAAVYEPSEYILAELDQLRHLRNDIVHVAKSTGHYTGERAVYQLKGHCEALLMFHITNSFKFACAAESAEFLSLPPNPKALKKKHRLLDHALRYRRQ